MTRRLTEHDAIYTTRNTSHEQTHVQGGDYPYPKGDLELSVVVFVACALVCFLLLTVRRCCCGGELGGGKCAKTASAVVMVLLWFIYVALASAKAYGMI